MKKIYLAFLIASAAITSNAQDYGAQIDALQNELLKKTRNEFRKSKAIF